MDPYFCQINNNDSSLVLKNEVKSVPIIFSWENLTVQTSYNPKKSFLYKKIINNGNLANFFLSS